MKENQICISSFLPPFIEAPDQFKMYAHVGNYHKGKFEFDDPVLTYILGSKCTYLTFLGHLETAKICTSFAPRGQGSPIGWNLQLVTQKLLFIRECYGCGSAIGFRADPD
jgi:hypothetical protein